MSDCQTFMSDVRQVVLHYLVLVVRPAYSIACLSAAMLQTTAFFLRSGKVSNVLRQLKPSDDPDAFEKTKGSDDGLTIVALPSYPKV